MLTFAKPKVFEAKIKTIKSHGNVIKPKTLNYVYNSKSFPPLIKQWYNSIYTFNTNTVILLPNLDKNLFKFINSYFNLYSLKLNKKVEYKETHIKSSRSSTNRLIMSKPELKHTNDKVNVVVYVYDRCKKYYINKIRETSTLNFIKEQKTFVSLMKNVQAKNDKLMLNISEHTSALTKKVIADSNVLLKSFVKAHFNSYIKKLMRKEIASFKFMQSISLQKSKHEKQHLLPLTNLLERAYNKKVIFDIVKLKYFYNSSHIFSDALITKFRNKSNKAGKVLKVSLSTFNLPFVDKVNVYDEMYNKKKYLQNPSVKTFNYCNNGDVLDTSLSDYNYVDNNSKKKQEVHLVNLYNIINSLKYKNASGIRVEIAGRLTKRSTADRSTFTIGYKGNIKNKYSSDKGLSTPLLRGYARSNLLYSKPESKVRNGAFGLKVWVNSS